MAPINERSLHAVEGMLPESGDSHVASSTPAPVAASDLAVLTDALCGQNEARELKRVLEGYLTQMATQPPDTGIVIPAVLVPKHRLEVSREKPPATSLQVSWKS